MLKQSAALILTLIIGLLTIGCASTEAEPVTAQEQPATTSTAVEVATTETGDISLIFNYSGNLQSTADIDVQPKVSGEVVEILVNVGDEVQAGDPLARIDDELLRLDLKNAEVALKKAQLDLVKMEAGARDEEIAAARASVDLARSALADVANIDDNERTTAVLNLSQAQAEVQRAQAEYDKIAWAGQVGTTPQAVQLEQATAAYEAALAEYNLKTNPSDSTLAPLEAELVQAQLNLALALQPFQEFDFELARTAIEQAETNLDRAELQIEYATIRAPFDGRIAGVEVELGSLVSASSAIVRLVSPTVEVSVPVEESRLGQLRVEQPASLNVAAYPGVDFPAIVSIVPPVADGTTHTFDITVLPQDERGLLRAGMYADVAIMADVKSNALLVPRAAVTLIDDRPVVYVVAVKDDRQIVERRDIITGLRDKDNVEILDGLTAGDTVVTLGHANLIDGADVSIIE
ncbi:MAG: efflux RND transporter periplasmic adaptor subunit [Anaerolineales bacterium]|nr:efflux RND transporter periplasmic adaptor subunit [Anaerolineales bacterium]